MGLRGKNRSPTIEQQSTNSTPMSYKLHLGEKGWFAVRSSLLLITEEFAS